MKLRKILSAVVISAMMLTLFAVPAFAASYNLFELDESMEDFPSTGGSTFFTKCGDPKISYEGGKIVMANRPNDYSGFDIKPVSLRDMLGGKEFPAGDYTLTVKGSVSTQIAEICLQDLGDNYARLAKLENQSGAYTLTATLSAEQLNRMVGGYSSIRFTGTENVDITVDSIVFANAEAKSAETTDNTGTTTTKNPSTGDNNIVVIAIAALAVTGTAAFVLLRKKATVK